MREPNLFMSSLTFEQAEVVKGVGAELGVEPRLIDSDQLWTWWLDYATTKVLVEELSFDLSPVFGGSPGCRSNH